MRKYYIIFLFLFRNGIADVYAQEHPIKHQIIKGETIDVIARKYNVNKADIYNLNPGLVNGFKENDLIIIPKGTSSVVYHVVQAGETKFGLSKKYNISIEELEHQNPQIISMLQKGHELKIQGVVLKNNFNTSQPLTALSNAGSQMIHSVEKGESLWAIARKYSVTVNQIVSFNGINVDDYLQIGQSIKIPIDRKREEYDDSDGNDYIVKIGETKYGLSKRFGITISELETLNPQIVSMLRTGQKITLPKKVAEKEIVTPKVVVAEKQIVEKRLEKELVSSDFVTHIVEAGETKHGLSKRFGTTISELENLNPHIVTMLNAGQEIRVPKSGATNLIADKEDIKATAKATAENALTQKSEEVQRNSDNNTPMQNLISYQVKPQETMYGISKMTGWSQQKLVDVNPELSNGLKTGMILRIPSESAIPKELEKTVPKVIAKPTLLQSIKKQEQKEIAFLMPFSAEEYADFLKSSKKEKIQDRTYLDFYAGAEMAMDSLKKNNVLITSKILKIENSNPSEADFSNLVKNNIEKYKTVIYPAEDYSAEKLGEYLSKNNVPLIVSDGHETAIGSATTYKSIPSKTHLRKLILDYIFSKNENVIIVNDASRVENRAFITENYPNAQFVKINKKGVFDSESLKLLLNPDNKNYVVLDTDKAGLILTTTTLLLKESNDYDVQIALLEPKDFIKEEKLSDMRFKILKMIYPSIHNPVSNSKINNFKKDFKLKYGFEPTQDALKGFDVTFDALLRLFQKDNFEVIAKEYKTEQLDFKFQYVKNVVGGYFNSGGYILQYDEDTNAKIIYE